nr:MAG: hypothetical protein [Bacteriophage sp.]
MKEFIFEVERRVYGWMKDRLSIEAETPEKVGECECGSQKAHDTLGIKYDSFEAILKNFG